MNTLDCIKMAMTTMANVTHEKYGSHSYACGTLESMFCAAIADMPKHKQREILISINRVINATIPALV